MAIQKKTETPAEISVVTLDAGEAIFYVLGTSPLVYNAVSQKAKRELLLPRAKLTTADKAANLKHDPVSEYRNSVYRRRESENGMTRLLFPGAAFHAALADCALDMPGSASKAKIGRLTWVKEQRVDIFGVPQMLMAVVRMADIGRTPDIRSRAIVPEWCARVTVTYMKPMLTQQAVATLFAGSGLLCGIGDGRQQKGRLNYGQFRFVDPDDLDFQRIMRTGGMAAQDEALNAEVPEAYDAETEELLSWYLTEIDRRGRGEPTAKKKGKSTEVHA